MWVCLVHSQKEAHGVAGDTIYGAVSLGVCAMSHCASRCVLFPNCHSFWKRMEGGMASISFEAVIVLNLFQRCSFF